MYRFRIYRKKAGERTSIKDALIDECTCSEERIAHLVAMINSNETEYDYYFIKVSGYIGDLDYFKAVFSENYSYLGIDALVHNELKTEEWLKCGMINADEAAELKRANKKFANIVASAYKGVRKS